MPGDYDDLVKIEFRGTGETGEAEVETLWATPLGDDLYRLENSPCFAYGVSLLDTVRARSAANGLPVFEAVVKKSGNRTVRVILDPPAEAGNSSAGMLDELVALGASYEGASRKYMAVNIGPEVDLERVCRFLTEEAVQWEHADPTYEALCAGSAG
ncbi:MAG: DUF4265 domain-containing protein [Kiloniellaceae bacterium]